MKQTRLLIFIILIALFIPAAAFAAKNSAVNLDITNNAVGYDISGGTTARKLTVAGTADMTLTGSNSYTLTFPASTDTLVGRATTDNPITNKTITGLALTAGTSSVAPLTFTTGTNLTAVTLGAVEYDGTWLYFSTQPAGARDKVFYGDTAVITSNFTTTSTTLTNVTGLAIAIPANQTWAFEFHLSSASTTTAGIKFAVTVPSGTLEARIFGGTSANTANRQERLSVSGTATSGAFSTSTSIDAVEWISGVCINGATAGNIQLQVHKVTSGTATVYAYGYVVARRIA